MSRANTNVETIWARAHAYPFVLALGALLVLFHAVVWTGEIAGLPFASWFAFHSGDLHVGAILFPFCNAAPAGAGDLHAFSSLGFLASFCHFLLIGWVLIKCGTRMEAHYSTKGLCALFVVVAALHAGLAAVVAGGIAFGTLAFAVFLVVSDLLVRLFDTRQSNEVDLDLRLLMLVSLITVAGISAGFVDGQVWASSVVALGAGSVFAVGAFVVQRRLQMRMVRRNGEGSVGGLYFVDETELLTRDEIQSRMDRLLDKIGVQGMESLTDDEQRFMKQASRRIKAIEEES